MKTIDTRPSEVKRAQRALEFRIKAARRKIGRGTNSQRALNVARDHRRSFNGAYINEKAEVKQQCDIGTFYSTPDNEKALAEIVTTKTEAAEMRALEKATK